MIDVLIRGGLWFTLPLSLLAIAILAVAAWDGLALLRRHGASARRRRILFQLGLFGFVFGLLGHAVGLYEMMQAIERIDSITPSMVARGLRVSMIVPTFGLAIFAGATLLQLLLEMGARRHGPMSASTTEDPR